MTERAQRIAIAKLMGWSKMTNPAYESAVLWHIKGVGFRLERDMPDYTHDLNAMAEVEAKLGANRLALYADELDKLCVPQHICALTHWQAVAMATAAQRAEALLRALNLWVDDTPSSPSPQTTTAP